MDDVLALPDHLRDALWRVESARLKPHQATGGLIVAGMGGSAIGGALARAVLFASSPMPPTQRARAILMAMTPARTARVDQCGR